MNETISNFYEASKLRTVTVGGPDGSPAIKVKLLHAAAAAVAGVLFAPRFTAIVSIAGLVKGVTVQVDIPPSTTAPTA